MKIPIQNLYYLLCFAWRYAPDELALNVDSIPASSDVLELCAYVLAKGTDHLLRRGLACALSPVSRGGADFQTRGNAQVYEFRALQAAEKLCS